MKVSGLATACLFALLGGCATSPSQHDPLGSFQALHEQTLLAEHQQFTGRFALKASFLPKPIQGRFEWRQTTSGAGAELLEFQNPWGEMQAGLGRLRSAGQSELPMDDGLLKPKDKAGLNWRVFDQKGGPVVAGALDRWALDLGLDAKGLAAFFSLLDELAPELKALPSAKPIVKRLQGADGWMELRLVTDPCCN